MKAIVYKKFGPPEVLQLQEVDKPAPKKDEVLIKINATTVTKYDCWVRSNTAPPGFDFLLRIVSGQKPKYPILGTELAGEIEKVGSAVTRFHAGDPVFGFSGMDLGAYAEYICLPEDVVARKPANISYQEAAAVPQGALTALYFLRKANIQPGQKVLIFGASGGVGSYAVQLAKHHFGADVTGVCSTGKLAFVRSLGADQVIDYTRQDFTQNDLRYDVLFDTVGKSSIPHCRRSLKEKGCYLFATLSLSMLFQLLWYSKLSSQKYVFGTFEAKSEDLIFLKELIETGLIKPVIDRSYPLAEAAQAHQYVESGQKIGNVVITI